MHLSYDNDEQRHQSKINNIKEEKGRKTYIIKESAIKATKKKDVNN